MKKNLCIVIIAILVIIIGISCYFFGFYMGKKSMKNTVAQYKEIINYYLPEPKEVFGLGGKIKTINDNVIEIETTIQDPYTLPKNWKTKTVKIIVTDNTNLYYFDPASAEKISISLSDLGPGKEIYAGSNENIKDKEEFKATYIELINQEATGLEVPEE